MIEKWKWRAVSNPIFDGVEVYATEYIGDGETKHISYMAPVNYRGGETSAFVAKRLADREGLVLEEKREREVQHC